MTDKYKALREALKAGPTPGLWSVYEDYHSIAAHGAAFKRFFMGRQYESENIIDDCGKFEREQDAIYVAAANPSVISELLDERDRMKNVLATVAQVLISDDPAICDTVWVPPTEGQFASTITLYELVMDVLGVTE